MKKNNLKYLVGFVDFRAEVVQQLQSTNQRPSSPISRPGSSDGSTTVSATSSPGIDQQEQEELNAFYRQVISSLIEEKCNAYCVCIVETKERFSSQRLNFMYFCSNIKINRTSLNLCINNN